MLTTHWNERNIAQFYTDIDKNGMIGLAEPHLNKALSAGHDQEAT